jgi:hypothetical protein
LTGCAFTSWLRIRQKAFFLRHAKSLPPLRHLQHQTHKPPLKSVHSFTPFIHSCTSPDPASSTAHFIPPSFNGTHAKEEDIEYQDPGQQLRTDSTTQTQQQEEEQYGRTWQAREEGGGAGQPEA